MESREVTLLHMSRRVTVMSGCELLRFALWQKAAKLDSLHTAHTPNFIDLYIDLPQLRQQ